MSREQKRFDWILGIGIGFATVVALTFAVFMWQWSEHKDEYYIYKMQISLDRQEFSRAAEYAELAEESGAVGMLSLVTYQEAEALFSTGNFTNAQKLYLELGVYEDASFKASACIIELAKEAEKKGDFQQAATWYSQSDRSDEALLGYQRCRYAIAEEAEKDSRLQEAFHLYWEIRNYSDAYEKALHIALVISGSKDEEEALRLARGYSREEWLHMEELKTAKERIVMHSLAAGWEHCLLLRSDGTVAAYGENNFGQTAVQPWEDVIAVSAGAYHSLALRSDGTVAATGSNEYGQCNVSNWKDVVAIECGAWDSFALTSQGTVLHCGFSDDTQLSSLRQVKQITTGNASWAAIMEDGTLVCSVPSGKDELWRDCTDVALGLGWTAILLENGTLDCTDYDLSEWTDVIELSASTTLLVGICADGSLKTQALMPEGAKLCDALNGIDDVKGIALSSRWAIILHFDDSVTLVGEPTFSLE